MPQQDISPIFMDFSIFGSRIIIFIDSDILFYFFKVNIFALTFLEDLVLAIVGSTLS